MAVTIQVSEGTFKRLQALASPFTDTPTAVIDRLLDAYETSKTANQDRTMSKNPTLDVEILSVSAMPDLTDTRIVEATFGDAEASTQYWNDLVRKVHEVAFSKLGDFDALRRASTANLVQGDMRKQKGYAYVEGLGISIQGVDSNEAWRIVYRLARKMNLPLNIMLEWRVTDKAEFPGMSAKVEWIPTSPPLLRFPALGTSQ